MVDKTIPYLNVIMRMDDPQKHDVVLPDGYTMDSFRDGDELRWAQMEYAVGDFSTLEEALAFFAKFYLVDKETLKKRSVMIRNQEGKAVSSCIAWYDVRNGLRIPVLEWLVSDPEYEGKGLARIAAAQTVNIFNQYGDKPVYLHTQPWSYKAIWLYHEYGFRLVRNDTFRNWDNQVEQALPIIEKLIPAEKMRIILSDMI